MAYPDEEDDGIGGDVGSEPEDYQERGDGRFIPSPGMRQPVAFERNQPVDQATPAPRGTQSAEDLSNTATAEEQFDQSVFPMGIGAKGPSGQPVTGANWAAVGGPEGRTIFENTYDVFPNRAAEAIDKGAQAQEDMGNEKAKVYALMKENQDRELARMKAERLQRDQELQQKQALLDEATQRYTNDLADRGALWHSPAGIIGAISASLMTLSGHPELGTRMIENQVNQDWQKRKDLANMHLGELRSNISSYRQLMHNKDAGDQLALSESYRTAAMELDRISQQFQGPMAKAKAEAIKADLYTKMNQARMNAYKLGIYVPPSVQKPEVAKALEGSPGYESFLPEKPTAQHIASMPKTGLDAALSKASGGKPTVVDEAIKTSGLLDERAPGTTKLLPMYRNRVLKEALVEANGDTSKVGKEVLRILNEDRKEAGKVAAANVKTISDLKASNTLTTELASFENFAKSHKQDPASMWNGIRVATNGGKWTEYIQNWRRILSDESGSKESAQSDKQLQAMERLHQIAAAGVLDYYHSNLGGSMSQQELGLAGAVVGPGSDWNQIKNFSQIASKKAGGNWNAIVSQATPRVGTRLQIRYGMANPSYNSTADFR